MNVLQPSIVGTQLLLPGTLNGYDSCPYLKPIPKLPATPARPMDPTCRQVSNPRQLSPTSQPLSVRKGQVVGRSRIAWSTPTAVVTIVGCSRGLVVS